MSPDESCENCQVTDLIVNLNGGYMTAVEAAGGEDQLVLDLGA